MATSNTVVLLSGGLDSTVLLHQVHERGTALPLFIDYGQRWLEPERRAARAQCRTLGLELRELDASTIQAAMNLDPTRRPASPLPHRNLVLTTLALSYAESLRADRVVTAVIRDDLGNYSCTLPSFWFALRDLAASFSAITVETPFIHLDKVSVIGEGLRLGVDFTQTYTCLSGREQHCGICRHCVLRRRSAQRAGLLEPAGFYLHDAAAGRGLASEPLAGVQASSARAP